MKYIIRHVFGLSNRFPCNSLPERAPSITPHFVQLGISEIGRHLQKPARGKAAAVVDGMGVKHRAPTTGHVEAGSIRTICPEHLIPNSFHILEQNLLTATVIEFRGPAVSMTSDPLS